LGSNSSYSNCFNFTFQIVGGSVADAAKDKSEEGKKENTEYWRRERKGT
jgi:hypothetical protein